MIATWIPRVLGWISTVYTLGLVSFLGLRLIGFADLPVIALLSSFQPFLFLPVLGIAMLGVAMRSRWALVNVSVGAVLFLYFYSGQMLPQPTPSLAADAPTLRVMTFNLGPGVGIPARLSEAIEREQADIVAVQELHSPATRAIQTRLSERYPYVEWSSDHWGVGILSRYPILERSWIQPTCDCRPFLRVTVDWDGQPVHVFSVHAPVPSIQVLTQLPIRSGLPVPTGIVNIKAQHVATEVARSAGVLSGPRIVAGDFNQSDQTAGYAALRSVLTDAFQAVGEGFGFTFPAQLRVQGVDMPAPLVRIDYIFHSSELRAQRAAVDCTGSSDHCYVVATLGRP